MRTYKRYFDETKCMYFVIKDEKVFAKCMKFWERFSNIIRKN